MKASSQLSRPLLYSLFGIYLALIGLSGCLFKENRAFSKINRDLIIRNDSIMSVNIELNQALQKKNQSNLIKSETLSYKPSIKK